MFKTLKTFGVRVQRSAFECQLSEDQFRRLYKKVIPCIDPETDLLRIYHLNATNEIFTLGSIGKLEPDDEFWIV